MSSTGSLSQYATHIGASPAYVTKLKKQGRIVMQQDGDKRVVNFDLSDRLIRNTTDMGRARNGANAGAQAPTAPIADVAAGPGRVDVIFRQAQAQERVFGAKLAELDYRKAVGELVRTDAIRAALASVISATRDALMQLPARLAPVLAAEADAARVHDVLQAELYQALQQLAAAPARVTQAAE